MTELKKVLSFKVILFITINSIMGTGIFFLPAFGASKAGPASLLSWLILSIISIYVAMCFAELVSMYPTAGGVYEFSKQAYGRFTSFLIGWTTILAGNITIAMLMVGAIVYLVPAGVTLFKTKLIVTLISIAFVIIFNYIAYRGMQTSAFMLVTFGFITLFTLFILIVPGITLLGVNFSAGNLGNFSPFFVFPVSALFLTIFFIAETFFGWETATFLAEETKDAEHVMPKALIYGTVIISVICLLFVITTLATIPVSGWENFPIDRPLTDIASSLAFPSFLVSVITIMVYLSIIGSVAGWIVSAPRLILALCRDKLFPGHLGAIHPHYGTPHKAIIFQTVLTSVIIMIGIGSYHTLLKLLLPMALFLYAAVIISLVVLRIKQPDKRRPYKQPLGIFGPIILALFLLSLIAVWLIFEPGAFDTLLLVISLILLGMPLYILIEMYYDPRMIAFVNNLLAYITLLTERIFLPISVRKKIIKLMHNIKGKTLLEYGCSVGTLTGHLAEEVGPRGKVYATDLSLKGLEITKRRMKNKNYTHVKLIHDPKHTTRVHPKVPKVSAIVSVGMISNIQDVKKVLKELNNRLKKNGTFCFMDYRKFFWIIPNVEWLSNDKEIKKIFRHAGYSINFFCKKSLFWEYIFIYGKKD